MINVLIKTGGNVPWSNMLFLGKQRK